jgi:hypothetical protein
MRTIGPPSLFTPVEQKREKNKKQTKKRKKRNKDLRKKKDKILTFSCWQLTGCRK